MTHEQVNTSQESSLRECCSINISKKQKNDQNFIEQHPLISSEKVAILRDRAAMLASCRLFFSKRAILEVDCPALSLSSPIDLHIDVMSVNLHGKVQGYLHTSPEYGMKRLLALGIGDIYQISHVFRDGEIGSLHNPEFTMVEWYRQHFDLSPMIEETLDFIDLFIEKKLPRRMMTYQETLQTYAGIDPFTATVKELLAFTKKYNLELSEEAKDWDADTFLQLIMSFVIEPLLGQEELFVIRDYPASQAALAQVTQVHSKNCSYLVAERFEVYFRGLELANGYHELLDEKEQRERLEQTAKKRLELGKKPLPLDEDFLKALKSGIPDCSGVAVGFDRLMMLRHHKNEIHTILSLPLYTRPLV